MLSRLIWTAIVVSPFAYAAFELSQVLQARIDMVNAVLNAIN